MDTKVIISKQAPENRDYKIHNLFDEQLIELAEIRNPQLETFDLSKILERLRADIKPVYVTFPWLSMVLRTVDKGLFIEIKTNRNKLLISAEEQDRLFNLHVSIAGMSVGSSLLYGLVGSGFCGNIFVADDDSFSTSNLNRVQATVFDVGKKKSDVAVKRALEMNPFLQIKQLSGRVTDISIYEFLFDGDVDVIFEEIDDFKMKILLREHAKTLKKPLIMLTNLGDSVMIDVERYDTQPDTEPFNGNVSLDIIETIKSKTIDQAMMKKMSLALVDQSLVPERAVDSISQIGKTLVGRPQLYATVALDGGIAPYLIKRIFIENNLPSGRYSLRLDTLAQENAL